MRYSRLPREELIAFLLRQGKEGEFWDFKQEWHTNTDELMKDIVCFANTVHDEDCFIVFGVADDLSITGMKEHRREQACILDAISNLVFAGDNMPSISVESVQYDDTVLDLLVIHNTDKTPLYLKKNYGKMRQGCIYARVGDRNTPDNGNAEIYTIESLWRKRFGLIKPSLEMVLDALRSKLDWTDSEKGYYHIYRPEYTIERKDDAEYRKDRDEFYSFTQTNEATFYYDLDIKAKGTTLDSYQIVGLDSGRLNIPVPEWGFVYFDEHYNDPVGYKYYIHGSHRETLLKFMYDPEVSDQRWAYNRFEKVILFYDSEEEKEEFEYYVKCHMDELKGRVESSDEYDYIVTENEMKTVAYKRELKTAVVLKSMLEEFRAISL